MTMPPDLTISIIHMKNAAMLGDCLRSIFAATHAVSLDVWVVDNSLTHEGLAPVRAEFPAVEWIVNDAPLGFSTNHNQVLRRARGRYSCILNDDTIIHDGAFDTLVRYMDDHPSCGMVAARLLNVDGTLQDCVFHFPALGSELAQIFILPRFLSHWKSAGINPAQFGDTPMDVDWALGACIVARPQMMAEVGLLDDEFSPVCNTEETDWCKRAHRAGWKVAFCPDARITHIGGQSTKGVYAGADWIRVELHRTRIAYFRRHQGRLASAIVRAAHCLALPWNAAMLLQGCLRRRSECSQFKGQLATLYQTSRMSLFLVPPLRPGAAPAKPKRELKENSMSRVRSG